MTERTKAARRSGNCERAIPGSGRTRDIVSDWERGTLVAGLLIAVSFGLMLVYGAVMF